jgi:signal transduction histidine kinase
MSTTSRARRFELEAAERRVVEQLKQAEPAISPTRRAAVVAVAVLLFGATFFARVVIPDPGALLANFYVVPTVVLAIEFGVRGGLVATPISVLLVYSWGVIDAVHVAPLGYVSRGAVVLITGTVVGRFSERLRLDIAERQRAQRDLSLYAGELERANQNLARTVDQLEAFAQIARAVGGETDLERVLSLILEHGREVLDVSRLVLYLPDGEELAAVSSGSRSDSRVRLTIEGSLPGDVLRTGRSYRANARQHAARLEQLGPGAGSAILVPLVFRGETLGVLAGIDDADGRGLADEDEQLLWSVAASAATAVATARSVAAARLRLSLDAADQARARWARELHDETLQGLTGVRMVLSAGRAREDPAALRGAADTADAHLADEMRKLRDLIAELRPAALDDLGLGPAIESLAQRQAKLGGFTARVTLDLSSHDRLPRDTETAIYRIAQEALSNAVKHAGADNVTVRVARRSDAVEVEVTDDGRGFDPQAATEGFGLAGMRERALLAGGRLGVISQDGGPTSVTAVLPLPSS